MTFSILVSSCSIATTTSYFVSKESVIHLIYHFTTDKLYIFFNFNLSYIFVFIFYIALIMKIYIFLLIGNWRKNHLIIYLRNRDNNSLWIKKWKSKIYKLEKVDDRISVLQVPRSRIKNQNQKETDIWIEKEGFIPGSRLDWWLKNSRSILEWSWIELWSTGRYASQSELTRQKPKYRISTKN